MAGCCEIATAVPTDQVRRLAMIRLASGLLLQTGLQTCCILLLLLLCLLAAVTAIAATV